MTPAMKYPFHSNVGVMNGEPNWVPIAITETPKSRPKNCDTPVTAIAR